MGGAPKMLTTASRISVVALLANLGGDVVGGDAASIGEFLEHDVHRPQVRRVRAQQQRLAGDAHGVRDAVGGMGDIVQPRHHGFGARDGGRVGQLHVDQQIALVLLGHEAGRRAAELGSRSSTGARRTSSSTITLTRNSPPTARV